MANRMIANTLPDSPVVWVCLGAIAVVGILAMLSPQYFSKLTSHSSQWIDTQKMLAILDRRIDIDQYVLPFSRALGFAVVGSVAIISVLLLRYL